MNKIHFLYLGFLSLMILSSTAVNAQGTKPAPTPGTTSGRPIGDFSQTLPYDNGVKRNSMSAITEACTGKGAIAAEATALTTLMGSCNPPPNCENPADTPQKVADCETNAKCSASGAATLALQQADGEMDGSISRSATAIDDTTGSTVSTSCVGVPTSVSSPAITAGAGSSGSVNSTPGNVSINLGSGTITIDGNQIPINKFINIDELMGKLKDPDYKGYYDQANQTINNNMKAALKDYYKGKGYTDRFVAGILDNYKSDSVSLSDLKAYMEKKKEAEKALAAASKEDKSGNDKISEEQKISALNEMNVKNNPKAKRKPSGDGMGVSCGDSVCGVPMNDIWKMVNKQSMLQCKAQNIIAHPTECLMKAEEN